jgi:3-keto-L-gulonate-6-phosphate decarboxylase
MSEREAAAYAGTYDDRRFVAERGNLYLLRGGGANAVKYRLQKAAGRLFVIDDDFLDGVRFEFAISSETGAATLTVLAIDGSRSEIARR